MYVIIQEANCNRASLYTHIQMDGTNVKLETMVVAGNDGWNKCEARDHSGSR